MRVCSKYTYRQLCWVKNYCDEGEVAERLILVSQYSLKDFVHQWISCMNIKDIIGIESSNSSCENKGLILKDKTRQCKRGVTWCIFVAVDSQKVYPSLNLLNGFSSITCRSLPLERKSVCKLSQRL